MVGATTHQPQQQSSQLPPQLSSSSSSAPATTPEQDELLKRNTDCVYFLASPLTCKKGSECEYRHSDIARVNPRDCWYWLNGSCLNPKCGFRHPPLDGLVGPDVSTPVGPSVPPPHPAPYAMPKQGVACIFFQKGYCLKGHLCPFLHGPPNSINNNKTAQSGSANPISEPPKLARSGPEKFQDLKVTQPVTAQKAVEFSVPQAVPLARNGGNGGGDKKAPPPPPLGVEEPPPRYKSGRVVTETAASKPNRGGGDRIVNGKDADEYSREPSPGFDVLVDNEIGDSEYYLKKDEFGRSRGGNDYDLDRPVDYDVDREIYHDYDHYKDRMSVGSGHFERRSNPRTASPDRFNGSDLRHRISKRVSDNGLRSVVSRDGRVARRDHHHHDNHHNHRQEQGGLSSRLRGRIKIPERSVSPSNGRRLRDRIKDNNNDSRDYKGFSRTSDNDSMFSGPKRLSELKRGSEQQLNEEQRHVLGKRKYPNEEDLSFEGPKPLSEILKSKRGSRDSHANNKEKEREMVVAEKEEDKLDSAIAEPEKQTAVCGIAEPEKQTDSAIDEDALLDEELEGYEDREGEYEYVDGEEEYEEEGEYVDEEEYGNGNGKKEESVMY